MRPRRAPLLAAILALLSSGGCHPASRSEPDLAYRAFIDAARAAHGGSEVNLLERFDASTRDALQARAAAASEATQKLLPPDPGYQLLLGDGVATAVTGVQVLQNDGKRAVVSVQTDGGASQATLVNEQGWKVHLDL